MELSVTLIAIAYVVGVILRIVYPYVLAWANDPDISWNWRMIAGQVVAGVTGLIPTLISAAKLAEYEQYLASGWIGLLLGLLAGFGAASIGREAQKTSGAVKAIRTRE